MNLIKSPRLWKNLIVVACVVGLYYGFTRLSAVWQPLASRPERPSEIKAFTLPAFPEGTLSSDVYRGRSLVLHFWASWCEVCRQEKPVFDKLLQKAKADNLEVVGIAVSDDAAALDKYAYSFPINYPVGIDADGMVAWEYKIRDLPQTFVVDKSGRIIRHYARALRDTDIDAIFNALKSLSAAPHDKNDKKEAL